MITYPNPALALTSPSPTFALLQLAEVFEGRQEAEVDAVAAAQVQEEVARAERRARVVDQLPG